MSLKNRSILLNIIVVMMPGLLTLIFLSLMNVSITNYTPTYSGRYNDAIYYWRQIYTFSQAGFNGGYYTIHEAPASAAFTHFYFYGPVFPMIYGALGRLFGWYPITGPIFNILLITVSLAAFLWITRPSNPQKIILAVTLALFWPLLVFLPTTMQESLHHTLAILLAAGFFLLLQSGYGAPRRLKIILFLLILVASLLRLTWGFLFIPFFLISGRRILPSLLIAIGCWVLITALFSYVSSPYPYTFTTQLLTTFSASASDAFALLINHIIANFNTFLTGHPLEIGQRLQVVAVIVLSGVGILKYVPRLNRLRAIRSLPGMSPDLWFHIVNLTFILAANIVLYVMERERDFRIIAPHLLFSILLLIVFKRLRLVLLVMLPAILLIGPFWDFYQIRWRPQFEYDTQRIKAFQDLSEDVVVYDPQAANAWCNTLLLDTTNGRIYHDLIGLPAGIGISIFVYSDALHFPLKSRYILVDEQFYLANTSRLNFDLLTETPIGNLYLNRDADC